MDTKAYEPTKSSDTRFIAHEHGVYCNQFNNWPIMYSYWEKRAQEKLDDPDEKITSDEVTEAQQMVGDLRDVKTITEFLAVLELTDLLTRASCQLQGTENFPWQHVEVIELWPEVFLRRYSSNYKT